MPVAIIKFITSDGREVVIDTDNPLAVTTIAAGGAAADVNVTDRAARDLGKVDIAAFDVSLPAGTNAIGKLAANTGVDIGDVDVTDRAARDLGKVDIAAFDVALPAGTNTIGKLGANSGVDIGDVDVTSIAAGENHLGQVGGEGITIAQTPTITAGAYAAGDAVGGLLTFANAGRASAEGSVLTDVLIIDDAGQDAELELWLFNQTFTAMADNAAWAPSEADLENLIAVVSTTDGTWRAAGTPSVVNISTLRRLDITGTSLFGQLVTRGTPTYAATDDLTVKVKLLND